MTKHLTPKKKQAILKDIQSGQMTRDEVAKKHNVLKSYVDNTMNRKKDTPLGKTASLVSGAHMINMRKRLGGLISDSKKMRILIARYDREIVVLKDTIAKLDELYK